MSHTQGQWDVLHCVEESCYFAPHWDVFARRSQNTDGSWHGQGVASVASSKDENVGSDDARLISAAPDLLASCKELLGAMYTLMRATDGEAHSTIQEWWAAECERQGIQSGFGKRAMNAIAKAESR